MKRFFKIVFFMFFSLIICEALFSKPYKVDFYGFLSKDADKNMLTMTDDLYLKQIKELDLQIDDKRSDYFFQNYITNNSHDFSASDSASTVFFGLITKLSNGKWECKINFTDLSNGQNSSIKKEYDSYYKILMESKDTIKKMLSDGLSDEEKPVIQTENPSPINTNRVSTQEIAGIWEGEPYIEKIMIMRGGRGFIIFKNGASMNIEVSFSYDDTGSQHIKIVQTSSANASYYPEISRKIAMEAAVSAKPITWDFTIENSETLTGVKTTLKEDSLASKALPFEKPVVWKKKL